MATKTKADAEVATISEGVDLAKITPAELRALTSPDELIAFYRAQGITPQDITEFGDGFTVLLGDDKTRLVGQAFHLIAWKPFFSDKYGVDGVFCWVMTDQPDKNTGEYQRFRVVDLSTGIANQLINDIQTHSPLNVPNGLVRSEYTNGGPNKDMHGVTFYLDTSARV